MVFILSKTKFKIDKMYIKFFLKRTMQKKNQFSKYAKEYQSYNIIQQICEKSLIREVKSKPKNILELGCGSGQVFSNINWEFDNYLAIDGSAQMCELHPKANNIEV